MAQASVHRDGERLVFAGALDRDAVPALWSAASHTLAGAGVFDLSAVSRVDSAGLALLAELAARANGPVIDGMPAGLSELRHVYRLSPTLSFTRA